jgi:hypothetical protein
MDDNDVVDDDALEREDRTLIRDWEERLAALEHLHRFVSIRGERFEWFRDVVLASRLYFPTFEKLNDPLDGSIFPTDVGTASDQLKRKVWRRIQKENGLVEDDAAIDRILALPIEEQRRRIHDAHAEGNSKLGVLSLCEAVDNVLMWAYYADGHRGLCLRFHSRSLVGLRECYGPIPVEYVAKPVLPDFYQDAWFKRSRVMIGTKTMDWGNEREWRIVRRIGDERSEFDPAALAAVIMGDRVTSDNESLVRQVVAQRPGVQLLRARMVAENGLIIGPA